MFNKKFTLGLALCTLPAFAFADIAYTNFGPGMSHQSSGWGIGQSGDRNVYYAFQFTSATSGILDKITIGARNFDGTSDFDITIFDDNADTVGSALKSWDVDLTNQVGTLIEVSNSDSTVSLTEASKYWVQIKSTSGTGYMAWYRNNQGISLLGASHIDGPGYDGYSVINNASVFQVETNAVPEPATLIALAAPLTLLARKRKIQK